MKSILYCAILTLPAAHGAPRKMPAKTATIAVPPKARVVVEPTRKVKVLVKDVADFKDSKDHGNPTEKNTVPKVVAARPVTSKHWRWIPRFQKTGRDDTTWGFLLKRPF